MRGKKWVVDEENKVRPYAERVNSHAISVYQATRELVSLLGRHWESVRAKLGRLRGLRG